jgi:hypothetical protein
MAFFGSLPMWCISRLLKECVVKIKAVLGSLFAVALVTTAIALPSAAQAANPGEVCNTNQAVWVETLGGVYLYELGFGAGFRVVGYDGPEFYEGHGDGKANGRLVRWAINQGSCHYE